ncbi:hypothetical protein F9K50_07905 [bacterium]|nr:MAG: hypothetical protein F9K50_07905 [bacterium]
MNSECRSKNTFAVSLCRNGHATLHLGRSAVFLDADELRALLEAAGKALAEYDKHLAAESPISTLENFRPQVSH